jgi:hypothetical protein
MNKLTDATGVAQIQRTTANIITRGQKMTRHTLQVKMATSCTKGLVKEQTAGQYLQIGSSLNFVDATST